MSEKKSEKAGDTAELITKKELSRRLRVSSRKIELDRNLPCIRWGRTVRYDWGEVLAYVRKSAKG